MCMSSVVYFIDRNVFKTVGLSLFLMILRPRKSTLLLINLDLC